MRLDGLPFGSGRAEPMSPAGTIQASSTRPAIRQATLAGNMAPR
jgi:hypothetical protein